MASARIVSVNIGTAADLVIGGRPDRSAIDKHPAGGAVRVGRLGLADDEHGDNENHGGLEQAVYAYAREDLDWWTEGLGRPLRDGEFGENVTTSGIDITRAMIGETWRLGAAVVQVTSPRIPCETFKAWTGEDHWVSDSPPPGVPARTCGC